MEIEIKTPKIIVIYYSAKYEIKSLMVKEEKKELNINIGKALNRSIKLETGYFANIDKLKIDFPDKNLISYEEKDEKIIYRFNETMINNCYLHVIIDPSDNKDFFNFYDDTSSNQLFIYYEISQIQLEKIYDAVFDKNTDNFNLESNMKGLNKFLFYKNHNELPLNKFDRIVEIIRNNDEIKELYKKILDGLYDKNKIIRKIEEYAKLEKLLLEEWGINDCEEVDI